MLLFLKKRNELERKTVALLKYDTMNSRSTVVVWHGDTLRVSRCFQVVNVTAFYPALDLLGVCESVCVCTTDKFSLFTNTRLFIGQIRKCVCMRVFCVYLYLPACKSGSRSIHSFQRSRLLIMTFLTEKIRFSQVRVTYGSSESVLPVGCRQSEFTPTLCE